MLRPQLPAKVARRLRLKNGQRAVGEVTDTMTQYLVRRANLLVLGVLIAIAAWSAR